MTATQDHMPSDHRLVDSSGRRFGQLPQRVAVQRARIGWRVRSWAEGITGWDESHHLTFRRATKQRDALIGALVLDGYALEMTPAGGSDAD